MGARDISSGIAILLLCIFGFISTSKLETGGEHVHYGAAFFPNMLMMILFGGALMLIGRGLYVYSRTPNVGKVFKTFKPAYLGQVILFWILLACYILLFNYTGFIISTILFLISAQVLFGRRKYMHIVMVSILGAAVTYLLLAILFQVPLPVTVIG